MINLDNLDKLTELQSLLQELEEKASKLWFSIEDCTNKKERELMLLEHSELLDQQDYVYQDIQELQKIEEIELRSSKQLRPWEEEL